MIRALALGLVLAGCATAPVPDGGADSCDVTVSFGSYGAGVDQVRRAQILTILRRDPGVATFEERLWGREGESELCVHAPQREAANRLFSQIAALIPGETSVAPISVRHRDGRVRATTYPRR